jgi:hypothetical protein
LGLGDALVDRGRLEEAAAVLREAIRLRPDDAHARISLGAVLVDAGRPEDATPVLGEAIRLAPSQFPAHLNLGRALMGQGRFDAALDALRRARELGARRGRRDPVADRLVRQCERLIGLDARLPALLRGEDRPGDAAELAGFAELCHFKQLFATSARLWEEAFAARPALAEDQATGNRFDAARAAARAGCGQGKDDPPPDDAERAKLRSRARDWLKADLRLWGERLDAGNDAVRRETRAELVHWKTSLDLACVRDPWALVKLPAEERGAWRVLWSQVDAMLAKAGGDHP